MKEKEKYSLKKINDPDRSEVVSRYVVVDKNGNHQSSGGSMAIYTDNHFVVMGKYSERKGHEINKIYNGNVDIKTIDRKVRNLAQKELTDLVKREEELLRIPGPHYD